MVQIKSGAVCQPERQPVHRLLITACAGQSFKLLLLRKAAQDCWTGKQQSRLVPLPSSRPAEDLDSRLSLERSENNWAPEIARDHIAVCLRMLFLLPFMKRWLLLSEWIFFWSKYLSHQKTIITSLKCKCLIRFICYRSFSYFTYWFWCWFCSFFHCAN